MNLLKSILLMLAVMVSCGKPGSDSEDATSSIKLETDVITVEGYSSSYTVSVTSESQ